MVWRHRQIQTEAPAEVKNLAGVLSCDTDLNRAFNLSLMVN